MDIKVFESISEIPNSIMRQCSYPMVQNFFLSINWFSCVYDTALISLMNPRIYCLIDHDQRAIGILFCATKEGERNLYSLTNFYTMEFGLISLETTGLTKQHIDHLAKFIESERPRWNAIDFRYILMDGSREETILVALKQKGFYISTYFMYENWYTPILNKDFNEFYSGLSSQLRNTIKRKENKLKKSHQTEIVIHKRNDYNLEKAIEDYVLIYNKSWKRPEPFPNFIPQLISTTSKLGILRLGILYIDRNPAAAQLWINTNKKALIYKLSYDENYSNYSPGSILSREMFRYAIDTDKVTEIDYGVGSENYKKDWMSSVRELKGARAYNKKTIKGLYLSINQSIRTMAKNIMEKS